jgi:DNA polymerase delta subunit 1
MSTTTTGTEQESNNQGPSLFTLSWYYKDIYDERLNRSKLQIYAFGKIKNNAVLKKYYNKQGLENKKFITTTLRISDFKLYFYLLGTPIVLKNLSAIDKSIKDHLDYKIKKLFQEDKGEERLHGYTGHDIVEAKQLYPYLAGTHYKFVKFSFENYEDFKLAKYYLTSPWFKINNKPQELLLFESKVDPLVKFYHNKGINSTGYISFIDKLKNNNFACIDDAKTEASTDISIMCNHKYIFPDTETTDIVPQVIASFDIETYSESREFPNPKKASDYIGLITVSIWTYGSTESNESTDPQTDSTPEFQKYAVLLNKTGRPLGYKGPIQVIETKTEKDLLIEYCKLIQQLDPDYMIGFNTWGFDEKYIYRRLELHKLVESYFNMLSRITNINTQLVTRQLKSSAYGENDFEMIDYIGRDNIDMMFAIRKEHKLPKYSLEAISVHFLNEHKEDLHFLEIFEKMNSSDPSDLVTVLTYGVQDTILPLKLIRYLYLIPNYMEMASTTFVPNNWLLYRGQQCKVFSLIVKYANNNGFLVPDNLPVSESFQGAKVLEPNTGAYYDPVAGLDFSSLYPSIMIAHNLDYSTIVMDDSYLNLPGVVYEKISWHEEDTGKDFSFTYVQDPKYSYEWTPEQENPKSISDIFKRGPKIDPKTLDKKKAYIGIMPQILLALRQGRKDTKKKMAELVKIDPKNEFSTLYKILDAKQLAQKVTMNSVYGFCGTGLKGVLPCGPVSACVTARGRQMIENSKYIVETEYRAKVLYGDSITGSQYVYCNIYDPNVMNKIQIEKLYSLLAEKQLSEKYRSGETYTNGRTVISYEKEQINTRDLNYMTLCNYKGATNELGSLTKGPVKSKLLRVIRHKTKSRLYRVTVKGPDGKLSSIEVTGGHSLIDHEWKLVSVENLKVGDLLQY